MREEAKKEQVRIVDFIFVFGDFSFVFFICLILIDVKKTIRNRMQQELLNHAQSSTFQAQVVNPYLNFV